MSVGTDPHILVVCAGNHVVVPRLAQLEARRGESGSYDPRDQQLSGKLCTDDFSKINCTLSTPKIQDLPLLGHFGMFFAIEYSHILSRKKGVDPIPVVSEYFQMSHHFFRFRFMSRRKSKSL
jgi:hypothetical protein